MSWSVLLIGKPEKVVEALKDQSTKLVGQSKVEFDSILPALIILTEQNFGADSPVIKITASGYGTAQGDTQISRYCSANVERVYGLIV